MKNLAIVALCFFSSFTNAHDIEEVTVTARQLEIVVLQKLADNHKQDPKTGDWYYVEEKKTDKA